MKITKTASGKKAVKMSRVEWEYIGKSAGWQKFSQAEDGFISGAIADFFSPGAGFFDSIFGWIKRNGVSMIVVILVAQVFAGVLRVIGHKIDSNADDKARARALLTRKLQSEILSDDDITEENMFTMLMEIEDRIEEKFPIKGAEFWAAVFNKTANLLSGKLGTASAALAGAVMAHKLSAKFDMPEAGVEALPDYDVNADYGVETPFPIHENRPADVVKSPEAVPMNPDVTILDQKWHSPGAEK